MLWLALDGRGIGAMHRKVRYQLVGVALLGLMATGLGGCFGGSSEDTETVDAIGQPLEGPSRLENQQRNVAITVPAEWEKAGNLLRDSADIYASYPLQAMYASVLSESSDVLDQFSLEDNADNYRWLIAEELSTYDGATKTEVNQINGDPAVQYEIRGRVDGVPVVYLHTTIEGAGRFYQVVGWTTAERYEENKAGLQEVIRSFEVI